MEKKYNFYMQKVDSNGNPIEGISVINIEDFFEGLRYLKAEGLHTIGKPKIYTESYADSDKMRVYIPNPLTNDPTTVNFDFVIVGENRYNVYKEFVDYIKDGFHAYWDDCRKMKLVFYIDTELRPAEEMFHGSTPYIKFSFQAKNIFGRTFSTDGL